MMWIREDRLLPLLTLAAALVAAVSVASCGREPSSLLRQGQLAIFDFPLYVSDAGGTIWKYEHSGARTAFLTGLSNPQGIAIDRFNNLWVVEVGTKKVLKYSTLDAHLIRSYTGFTDPYAIAIDSVGEAYVTQEAPHNVVRVADGAVISDRFTAPTAIGFGVGDVMLVGDKTAQKIYWGKDSTAESAYVNTPTNISIDGMGRVYVASGVPSIGKVVRFHQTVPGSTNGTVIAPDLDNPQGIAVDPVGNVYYMLKSGSIQFKEATTGLIYAFGSGTLSNPSFIAFTQY